MRVSDIKILPNPLTLSLSPFQGERGLNQRFLREPLNKSLLLPAGEARDEGDLKNQALAIA